MGYPPGVGANLMSPAMPNSATHMSMGMMSHPAEVLTPTSSVPFPGGGIAAPFGAKALWSLRLLASVHRIEDALASVGLAELVEPPLLRQQRALRVRPSPGVLALGLRSISFNLQQGIFQPGYGTPQLGNLVLEPSLLPRELSHGVFVHHGLLDGEGVGVLRQLQEVRDGHAQLIPHAQQKQAALGTLDGHLPNDLVEQVGEHLLSDRVHAHDAVLPAARCQRPGAEEPLELQHVGPRRALQRHRPGPRAGLVAPHLVVEQMAQHVVDVLCPRVRPCNQRGGAQRNIDATAFGPEGLPSPALGPVCAAPNHGVHIQVMLLLAVDLARGRFQQEGLSTPQEGLRGLRELLDGLQDSGRLGGLWAVHVDGAALLVPGVVLTPGSPWDAKRPDIGCSHASTWALPRHKPCVSLD
eukprot:scaffold716_cov364-Pinguiococcus_pyrenoidosus.AAC.13